MSDYLFSVFPSENFVDLGLFQFGREKCSPGHSFGPAARNHFLFHYVISGKGVLNIHEKDGSVISHSVKSMQGFMIFPDQITTYIADAETPWEYVWVEFDGLRVRGLLKSAGITEKEPIYRARYKDIREKMREEMEYITENSKETAFNLIGHLYLFVDYLVRSSAPVKISSGSKLRDFYIHEALVYIEHNFQNNISVETIASECGLNRSYFGKIFKEALGVSPQEFLINFRMAKAAELMKLSSLSIGDIGLAVGYDNPLHFSRAFKNIYGTSPREWRNKNMIAKSDLAE